MRELDRYVSRQLVLAFLIATVALTVAVWLSQSLRLVDMIVNQGLPFSDFLYLAILMLPTFLVIILPIALFAAVLFTYNRLTTDSELVVMRAAGVSHLGLARPALLVASCVTAFIYLLTIYLMPVSYREFKDLQFQHRNDYSTILLREGTFNTLANHLTVYVRERKSDGELLGILVHDAREPDHPVTLIAEHGALVNTDKGPRVVLVNGNRQEVEREKGKLSLLYFDRYSIDVSNLGDPLGARWREPRERYVWELLSPGNSPDDVRYRNELVAEGHQRLAAPLYALVLTLAALATMLFGTFERRGQAPRILIAVSAAIAIESAGLAFGNLSAKEPVMIPLVHALPLLLIAAGLYLLRERRIALPTPAAVSSVAPSSA